MKRATLISVLYCLPILVMAQKETNNWYFGRFAGISFDQSPPTPIGGSFMVTEEGCASISDRNGNMLFYTNGLVVFNAQNLLMKNGTNLAGDRSSTQNAVIVPQPGNDSMYYIFTVGAEYQADNGLRYSIVNMNREDGLGEVVAANIPLCTDCMEKVAAVRHCNKRDFWIVSQRFNSGGYQVYGLKATGLLPQPVISNNTFPVTGQTLNTIGAIKFSSDGRKLAVAHGYHANRIELLDFDHSTGVLSNSVTFNPSGLTDPNPSGSLYGLEFSPDSKFLYITANDFNNDTAFLYQVEVSTANAAAILASRKTISTTIVNSIGNVQAGPDQKLYVTYFNAAFLGVINNPNVSGAGCNYVQQGLSIGPGNNRSTQGGLPTFVASFLNPESQPFDFSRLPGDCSNRTVGFVLSRQTGIDSLLWNFGDGQQSKVLAPFHTYSTGGFFDVQLIVYKVDCSGQNDTVVHRIWIAPSANLLGADVDVCFTQKVQLSVAVSDASYLWNTGSTAATIPADTSGLYWVRVKQYGCTVSDSVNVLLRPAPAVDIGADTAICLQQSVVFDAGYPGSLYAWSTGATTRQLTVTKPGTYRVAVTQNGCTGRDTVVVGWGDCELLIPGGFTPNGDGRNDLFGLLNPFSYQSFSFAIFDRWGQVVFSSRDAADKWDGRYKGLDLPGGAYPWLIRYVNKDGLSKMAKGIVILVR